MLGQTAEAVDGKSADDHGRPRAAETLGQLRDAPPWRPAIAARTPPIILPGAASTRHPAGRSPRWARLRRDIAHPNRRVEMHRPPCADRRRAALPATQANSTRLSIASGGGERSNPMVITDSAIAVAIAHFATVIRWPAIPRRYGTAKVWTTCCSTSTRLGPSRYSDSRSLMPSCWPASSATSNVRYFRPGLAGARSRFLVRFQELLPGGAAAALTTAPSSASMCSAKNLLAGQVTVLCGLPVSLERRARWPTSKGNPPSVATARTPVPAAGIRGDRLGLRGRIRVLARRSAHRSIHVPHKTARSQHAPRQSSTTESS